jgi:endo-1,4-beta-xylanase
VAITELDIAQAGTTDYVNAVKGCVQEPKCVGVTVWGVSDANSWRSGDNPLLFDRSFNAKAAYNALMQQL